MSHFVRIQTVIRERETLIESLKGLGFAVEESGKLSVHGDSKKTEDAEILVRTGCSFDIGLRRVGQEYEIVADWYRIEHLTSLRRQEFVRSLTRCYARSVVLSQAREQNLIVEENVEKDGSIVIVLSERG